MKQAGSPMNVAEVPERRVEHLDAVRYLRSHVDARFVPVGGAADAGLDEGRLLSLRSRCCSAAASWVRRSSNSCLRAPSSAARAVAFFSLASAVTRSLVVTVAVPS